MSRVEELRARIKQDEEELKLAIKAEKSEALKRIREEIKLYGFKTTDFKNVLATRKKRNADGTKPATKRAPKKPV